MQKVLILGAGMIAKPLVKYLLEKNYHITIASRTKQNADEAIAAAQNCQSIEFDIDKQKLIGGFAYL